MSILVPLQLAALPTPVHATVQRSTHSRSPLTWSVVRTVAALAVGLIV
jgi:hypothetical protein